MAALIYTAQKGMDNKKAYTTPVIQAAGGGGRVIGSSIVIVQKVNPK